MRRALAVAVGLALAAGGCGKRTEPPPAEITLSVPYDVDTLDPHARDRLGNFAVAVHFYEPLVGTDREMGIYPKLAVRWDNPDLLTWISHLKAGAIFHDGSPFTAADVVYSFERLTRQKGLDIGLYTVQVASVRALDPETVEIRTRRPMAVLLNKISSVLIVPKGATASWLAEHENGTGPYRLAEWKKGREITMTWSETFHGKRPALSRARFLLSRTPEDARKELLRGTSQFAQLRTRAASTARASSSSTSASTSFGRPRPSSRAAGIRSARRPCARRSPWPSTGRRSWPGSPARPFRRPSTPSSERSNGSPGRTATSWLGRSG